MFLTDKRQNKHFAGLIVGFDFEHIVSDMN
jgi:hypothetical protein